MIAFKPSIPRREKSTNAEPLELIGGSHFDDFCSMRTGYNSTGKVRNCLFEVGYNEQFNTHYFIKEQLEYYLKARNKHGWHQAGSLAKIWLRNRKERIFFCGDRLYLEKESLPLLP